MSDAWLPTLEELDNYQDETKDETIERLSRAVDYLMGRYEAEETQSAIKIEFAAQQREKRKSLKPSTGFVKVHKLINQRAVREKMFKPAEERMLFKLIPFCNLESGIITDEEGFSMSQKDIVGLVGMDKKDVQDILASLVDKGVITRHTRGRSVFYKFSKEWFGN